MRNILSMSALSVGIALSSLAVMNSASADCKFSVQLTNVWNTSSGYTFYFDALLADGTQQLAVGSGSCKGTNCLGYTIPVTITTSKVNDCSTVQRVYSNSSTVGSALPESKRTRAQSEALASHEGDNLGVQGSYYYGSVCPYTFTNGDKMIMGDSNGGKTTCDTYFCYTGVGHFQDCSTPTPPHESE